MQFNFRILLIIIQNRFKFKYYNILDMNGNNIIQIKYVNFRSHLQLCPNIAYTIRHPKYFKN